MPYFHRRGLGRISRCLSVQVFQLGPSVPLQALLGSHNASFCLFHTPPGCLEVSFVHGDLVLACSDPFAEEHRFVAFCLRLVQLCFVRSDSRVIVWVESNSPAVCSCPNALIAILHAFDGASASCCEDSSGFFVTCRSCSKSFSSAATLADSFVDLVGGSRVSDLALKASPFARWYLWHSVRKP